MLFLCNWYHSLTEAIQAAWITSIGTCLAAVLTIFGGWVVLTTQLRQDRTQRQKDRSIELKKELYADAIAGLSSIGTNLANWANVIEEETKIAAIYAGNMAKIRRLHLVSNLKILQSLDEFDSIYLKTYLYYCRKKVANNTQSSKGI